jgi:multidrug efflux system membrane fusion protein
MFTVEISLPNPNNLRAGISTEAHIFAPKVLTHFVSPALLSINEHGTVGIKTVDAQSTVHFQPVHIIRSTSKGLWLSGLKPQVTLISTGQGFVEEGESIIAVKENTAKGHL